MPRPPWRAVDPAGGRAHPARAGTCGPGGPARGRGPRRDVRARGGRARRSADRGAARPAGDAERRSACECVAGARHRVARQHRGGGLRRGAGLPAAGRHRASARPHCASWATHVPGGDERAAHAGVVAADGRAAARLDQLRRASAASAALLEGRPAPPAVLELSAIHDDPTFVLAPGHDPAQLEAFAGLAGSAAGEAARGAAPGTSTRSCRRSARTRSASRSSTPSSPSTARGWSRRRSSCCRRCARSTPARLASWRSRRRPTRTLEVPGLGGELKPFQRAGVSYLLAQRRAFLADEQGLGKTIEALAALEADGAYPAVVVCPASLKLNWLRELERWLPGRSARVAGGHRRGRPRPPVRGPADDHRRQLRHPRGAHGGAARARAARAGARRVALLQERRRQAHPGGAAARGDGAARGPRDGAHGHAGDEPSRRS